jgi:P27 family predicted phage terminase small subunit
VPALVRVGVASSIDSAALLGLCQHWGQWVECQEALAEMEPNDKSYYRLQVMASVAWKQFEKTALHFGLTPAARERLHAAGGEIDDVDPFDLLMSRG